MNFIIKILVGFFILANIFVISTSDFLSADDSFHVTMENLDERLLKNSQIYVPGYGYHGKNYEKSLIDSDEILSTANVYGIFDRISYQFIHKLSDTLPDKSSGFLFSGRAEKDDLDSRPWLSDNECIIFYRGDFNNVYTIKRKLLTKALSGSLEDVFEKTKFGKKAKAFQDNISKYFEFQLIKDIKNGKPLLYLPGQSKFLDIDTSDNVYKFSLGSSFSPDSGPFIDNCSLELKGYYKEFIIDCDYSVGEDSLSFSLRHDYATTFFGGYAGMGFEKRKGKPTVSIITFSWFF